MRHVFSEILALGLLCAAGTTIVVAQNATPTGDSQVELMFVQTFSTSTLTPSRDDPSRLVLTLEQGTGEMIFLSDRPDRIAGSIKTDMFIEEFRKDPANAALVVNVNEKEEAIYVVELLAMEHDPASGTVTYTVRLLEEPSELDLGFRSEPRQLVTAEQTYGTSNLFIDGGGLLQLVAYGAQD
jgi:hypothetical protein